MLEKPVRVLIPLLLLISDLSDTFLFQQELGSLLKKLYDIYKEQILAGADADLIVFETMTDLYELKAAVLAAKENSDLPIV